MRLASVPKAFVGSVVRPLIQTWERVKFSGCYTNQHDNLDPNVHLREAIGWINRAQDFGSDRGVSYGARFGHGFQPSYPETTGYIICTFVELSKLYRVPEYLERAIEMGLWEIAVQMDNGAVMAGQVNANPSPAVFNTGQVLLGWASLYEETHDQRFAKAGECAAAWLMSMQEPNGHWIRGNSKYADRKATLYNVKAAWGLGRMGQAIGSEELVRAAIKNAEYTVSRQTPNGWFPDCCLSDSQRPLLHTIAYTMQGLIGIGLLTGRQDFIESTARTANKLLNIMDPQGFLPGRFNKRMEGCVDWCCLTGTAQTAIVWAQLYQLTRREEYRQAVQRANQYLMARHDITSADPAIRGGVAGSWPVWSEYVPFMVLNWATKFFVDALLAEQRIRARAQTGGNNA
jgi:uncharacterized protein YyaL (SSP411 family)